MAPVLSFLRPTEYEIVRIVLERILDVYLLGEKQLIKIAKKNSRLSDFKFSIQNEGHLRFLLCKCPWWILGHLELGFLALEMSESHPDSAQSARAIGTAKISAEAAKKLLGPAHKIVRGRKLKILLKARALDGLVLAHHRRFEESLEVLKNVLALNNAQMIPKDLLYKTLECAANAAYLTGNGQLALEFFNRVPPECRTREGIMTLNALTSES